MRVSTNLQSMVAQRYVKAHTEELAIEDSKISSGDRIVRSAIDPAGMAISDLMKAKLRSNSQAERNSNDAISLIQVAEGSLGIMSDLSIRLRELAVQASTDTLGDENRAIIDTEFQALKGEVQRLTASTSFNGNNIIKDSGSVYDLQVGISGDPSQSSLRYDLGKIMDSKGNFGIANVNLRTKASAQQSMSKIDGMMSDIGRSRAELGSLSKRMESVIQNLQISRENTAASNSKIRDADMAKETAIRFKTQIAQTATLDMLKSANDRPSEILRLVS
jgi:flagellin